MSKIQFAPVDIPLNRRLQTAAVVLWIAVVLAGGIVVLTASFYLLFYTNYNKIFAGYLIWFYIFDLNICEQGGRPYKWVKNLIWWKYMASYFPAKLFVDSKATFDAKKNYLFCCFPHGIMASGILAAIVTEGADFSKHFPKHTSFAHTLKINFYYPFVRELLLGLGMVSSSAKSLNYLLSHPSGGNICCLIVGGAAESVHCKPGSNKLVLKNRKGFIKVALRNGAPLVPVYTFGETDIYTNLEFDPNSKLMKFQKLVKKYLGFFPLIPIGRGIFQYNYGIVPNRRQLTVVVGDPIEVKHTLEPTQEEIDRYHALFIEKITDLFEKNKSKYIKDADNAKLEIL